MDANGLIDLSAHDVLDLDRVMTPEPEPSPDATITVTGTPTEGVAFQVSVADQGGEFAWSVAGARVTAGQGTREATIQADRAIPIFISCAVALAGKVDRKHKSLTVAEA